MELRKGDEDFCHKSYYLTMKSSKWFVYIIQTEKGHLYTGITTDIERRFKEHSNSSKGAKYFRGKVPVHVIYHKIFKDRSSASKHEALIKKMKRSEKLLMIENATND